MTIRLSAHSRRYIKAALSKIKQDYLLNYKINVSFFADFYVNRKHYGVSLTDFLFFVKGETLALLATGGIKKDKVYRLDFVKEDPGDIDGGAYLRLMYRTGNTLPGVLKEIKADAELKTISDAFVFLIVLGDYALAKGYEVNGINCNPNEDFKITTRLPENSKEQKKYSRDLKKFLRDFPRSTEAEYLDKHSKPKLKVPAYINTSQLEVKNLKGFWKNWE